MCLLCVFVVRYENQKKQTEAGLDSKKENERARERENQVFWQLELALVVIRREGSEKERGIWQNKASPRKRKAPL